MIIKFFKDDWKNLFFVTLATLVYALLFFSRIQDASIKIWFQALAEAAPLIFGVVSIDHTLQHLAKNYYREQTSIN